jgi:hypothetical protein
MIGKSGAALAEHSPPQNFPASSSFLFYKPKKPNLGVLVCKEILGKNSKKPSIPKKPRFQGVDLFSVQIRRH